MLIRQNDGNGHGELYTYFSKTWNAPLIPYRQWLPEENLSDRQRLNARKLSEHWGVRPETIAVNPVTDKFAISAKPQVEYGDLVFTFLSSARSSSRKNPNLSGESGTRRQASAIEGLG